MTVSDSSATNRKNVSVSLPDTVLVGLIPFKNTDGIKHFNNHREAMHPFANDLLARPYQLTDTADIPMEQPIIHFAYKRDGVTQVPQGRLTPTTDGLSVNWLRRTERPGPDGHVVCVMLKAHPGLQNIPVILTRKTANRHEKVKVFEYNGTDCLSKPFGTSAIQTGRKNTWLRLK